MSLTLLRTPLSVLEYNESGDYLQAVDPPITKEDLPTYQKRLLRYSLPCDLCDIRANIGTHYRECYFCASCCDCFKKQQGLADFVVQSLVINRCIAYTQLCINYIWHNEWFAFENSMPFAHLNDLFYVWGCDPPLDLHYR